MNPDGKAQRRVWRAPKGYGAFGGFSRDGKWAITFNQFNLYLHDLNKSRRRRFLLWNGGVGSFIASPSFSPDGKYVLCTIGYAPVASIDSDVVKLNVAKTYSVLKDRGAITKAVLRPVTRDSEPDLRDARWSLDGRKIVFAAGGYDLADKGHGRRLDLWTMNSDGSGARRVTDNKLWDEMPALSPRQDKNVFVRHFSDESDDFVAVDGCDLYLVNTDGTNERRLTFNRQDPVRADRDYERQSNPIFSPSGSSVVFDQEQVIYEVSIEGGRLKKLTDGRLIQWIY